MATTARGPFTLNGDDHLGWDIYDGNGNRFARLAGILVDGSGRGKYPDGVIVSREQRRIDAQFTCDALNAAFARRPT